MDHIYIFSLVIFIILLIELLQVFFSWGLQVKWDNSLSELHNVIMVEL